MKGEAMAFGEWQRVLESFSIEDWDKIVIMQYTGLKDKNGKEIYEGDVVRRKAIDFSVDVELPPFEAKYNDEVSVIEYRNHGFWVKDERFGWEGEGLWHWDEMEVIGNIYENPELLSSEPCVEVSDTTED